ncbi:MAG TPA: hypothetical protein VFA41_18045 [Ktedonobacteraceae bacterium]|jgi:hypothetical protein|nr:hypothetical protein [Ktedonobacteraceae bacterium]
MEPEITCNWLLQQDPIVVKRWIVEIVEEKRPDWEDHIWPCLAEGAAALSRRKGEKSGHLDLEWASVCVMAYSYMIQGIKRHRRFVGPRMPEVMCQQRTFSYAYALMLVRETCILQLGHVPGDLLRDVNHFIHWFFEDLAFTPETYLQQRTKINILTLAERLELQRCREKLSFLMRLEQAHVLPSHQELQPWLDLGIQLEQEDRKRKAVAHHIAPPLLAEEQGSDLKTEG